MTISSEWRPFYFRAVLTRPGCSMLCRCAIYLASAIAAIVCVTLIPTIEHEYSRQWSTLLHTTTPHQRWVSIGGFMQRRCNSSALAWVGGWVSEWVSEWIQRPFSDNRQGPCNPYKQCNHYLYIEIGYRQDEHDDVRQNMEHSASYNDSTSRTRDELVLLMT